MSDQPTRPDQNQPLEQAPDQERAQEQPTSAMSDSTVTLGSDPGDSGSADGTSDTTFSSSAPTELLETSPSPSSSPASTSPTSPSPASSSTASWSPASWSPPPVPEASPWASPSTTSWASQPSTTPAPASQNPPPTNPYAAPPAPDYPAAAQQVPSAPQAQPYPQGQPYLQAQQYPQAQQAPPAAAYPYGPTASQPAPYAATPPGPGAGYPGYGYPQPGYAAPPAVYRPVQQNTSAIVLTIISALLTFSCYLTIAGIVPLVFGVIALNKQTNDFEGSKRMARYGWIAMAAGGVITVIGVIVFIALLATPSTSYSY